MAPKSVLFRFGSDVSGLMQGLAQGKGGLRDLDKAADGVASTLTKFAVLAGGGLGIAKLTADALAFADSMVRIHDQTDLSYGSIQRFSFIAGQTGGSVEQLAGAVSKMQRTLSDAGDDGEKARKAVAALGLDISSLMSMKPDEQFETIAKAIATIPNPADQAAAAVDIFGKAGAESLPQIKAVAESGAELAAQFSAIGGPVSEEAILAVDGLGDAGTASGLAIKSLATELLASLAPALTATLEGLNAFIGALRLLDGEGENAVVNLDNKIRDLDGEINSLIHSRGAMTDSVKEHIVTLQAERAELLAQQATMLGLGVQQQALIPIMQEWGAVALEMPTLAADALSNLAVAEVTFTAQQLAEYAIREEQTALYWDNIKAITQSGTDAVGEIHSASLSKAEMFNAQSWDSQVATVAGSLQQMTAGIAQHSKAAFEVNKAASATSTIFNTIAAVTKAWGEYGWPYGAIIGAAIAAAGAAQLNAIKSTTFQGGGRGIPPSNAATPAANVGQGNGSGGGQGGGQVLRLEGMDPASLYSGSQVRALAERLAEHQKDGGTVLFG